MPCSFCGCDGHNRRTCPQIRRVPDPPIDEPELIPENNLIPQPPQHDPPIQQQLEHMINPWEPINQRWMNDMVAINNNQNNENNENEFSSINKIDINIHNMNNENYILYLVCGNSTVWDLDTTENDIRYIGIITSKSSFDMKRSIGARVLVIPYENNTNQPEFHPPTDQKLWTKSFCKIDIDESHKINNDIYINDGNQLSELNKWKFNALKLDYLMKELIRLGGKNYDNLEPILDLHQDIKLDDHNEFDKDRSGIPSSFTNIT